MSGKMPFFAVTVTKSWTYNVRAPNEAAARAVVSAQMDPNEIDQESGWDVTSVERDDHTDESTPCDFWTDT